MGATARGAPTRWSWSSVLGPANAGPSRFVVQELDGRYGAGRTYALGASGAVVLYSSHFPPRGDIHNFAWRAGGAIGYSATRRLRIELGGQWMHVSNGQVTP